ncbi:MAG: right-handed parallel beta-helix repeat-containing protein [Candidatus Marinimicrobia bacterium]|nr:right-handed parallel beta-helix repeat-containing protein [Candidatus Neomarinimicrobiota bacterium]
MISISRFQNRTTRMLVLLGLVLFFNNCTFRSIHQPDLAAPDSSITVTIQIQRGIGMHGEGADALPHFGVLLPNGWSVDDSLEYQHAGGPGWIRYSIEYSDTMEIIDPAPSGYYWWVGLDTITSSIPAGMVDSQIEIFTDSQEGTFFIDYMLGHTNTMQPLREDQSGLNVVRSNDHPVSVNAPMDLRVTNMSDSGIGSLRQALAQISARGTISFEIPGSDSIQLDSQLVVDRSVTILGPADSEIILLGGDTSRIMQINSHLDVSISDLTLKNGNIIGKPGGAILTENTGCDLEKGSITIFNSKFMNNRAIDGGGVYVSNINLTLDHCRILSNTAQFVGGGIFARNSNLDISSSFILNNTTTSSFDDAGGGIYLDQGRSIIASTLIAENSTESYGGGLYLGNAVEITFSNATFIDNSAMSGGGNNIFVNEYADVSVLNSIIGNSQNEGIAPIDEAREVMTIHHSNLVGTFDPNLWTGENNISVSPLFVDPNSNDYHLQPNSPCIDIGAPWSRQDSDGTTADLGAFTTQNFAGTGEFPPGIIGGTHAGVISTDVLLGSDLIVAAGSTLTIAPGVTITSMGFSNKILVYGTLEAQGSVDDTIRFLGGDNGWNGIEFNGESASESHLQYCLISNARRIGIACLSSSPTIENSLISRNGLDDELGRGGVYCENSGTHIINTQITQNENHDYSGGGITAFESSHLVLNGVDILNNYSAGEGGGIAIYNSSIVLENVRVAENVAQWNGAGIFTYNTSLSMMDCDVFNNITPEGGGGGISIVHEEWYGIGRMTDSDTREAGFTHLKGVNIDHNSAYYGAGISTHGLSNILFNGVSITRNMATEFGGGLDCWNSNPLMVNITLADNSTESGTAQGMSIRQSSRPRLVNSIIWGESTQDIRFFDADTSLFMVAYSDVRDGEAVFGFEADAHAIVSWEVGNITSDPLFTNPEEGMFEIVSNSPCIDAGVAQFEWEGEILVNLSENEYMGIAPDIGAIQVGLPAGNSKELITPVDFALSPNFPNPFNTTTTLRYSIPSRSEVKLEIFDILGREIATLADDPQEAGQYFIYWDGKNSAGINMSTGLYFYRLRAQTTESNSIYFSKVRKMVLIK